MAYALKEVDRLVAETTAQRIVIQRLLFQLASQVGDRAAILRQEHKAAMDDLSRVNFLGASQERSEALQGHAQRVLDEMHTAMRPRPQTPQS